MSLARTSPVRQSAAEIKRSSEIKRLKNALIHSRDQSPDIIRSASSLLPEIRLKPKQGLVRSMRTNSEAVLDRLHERSRRLMESLICIDRVPAEKLNSDLKTFNMKYWDQSYNAAKEHGLALREKCQLEYEGDDTPANGRTSKGKATGRLPMTALNYSYYEPKYNSSYKSS